MAYRTTHVWQLKPGRTIPELVPTLRTAKTIHERHGAEVSAWVNLLAGPSSSARVAYTLEYADVAAFGKGYASFGADPQWMPLWQGINGPDSVATLVNAFAG